jgi:cytochrome c-type biogenesis protein CcmH/NrfF
MHLKILILEGIHRFHKILWHSWVLWLTPVILATQEAEIRRIAVRRQPRKTLSQKTLHKNRAGGVAHGKGPEFKP